MGYMYFLFSVAVLASIVGLCWRQYVISNAAESVAGSAAAAAKNTLEGRLELETRRIELRDRIDHWQEARARRMQRVVSDARSPIAGEKYVFTPAEVSRARSSRNRSTAAPLSRRFELID